jgi:hypothetical protein
MSSVIRVSYSRIATAIDTLTDLSSEGNPALSSEALYEIQHVVNTLERIMKDSR